MDECGLSPSAYLLQLAAAELVGRYQDVHAIRSVHRNHEDVAALLALRPQLVLAASLKQGKE